MTQGGALTTEIVPVENIAALDSLSTEAREVAITGMLDQARSWLAHAVESTAPAQDINQFRQFIATAAETAKRLKVSKEIQQDAEVMVRRSERALGQAIRRGQEAGEITTWGGSKVRNPELGSPRDYFSSNDDMTNTYSVTDDVSDSEFEEALDRALEEGNVSRANTVRKVREVKSGAERLAQKWEQVAALAAEGHTSRQIAAIIGANPSALRESARERGIDIPADRATHKKRQINSDRILSGVADSLTAAAFSIQQINPLDLDQETAQEQVDSLTESLTAIRKAVRKIKESIQ